MRVVAAVAIAVCVSVSPAAAQLSVSRFTAPPPDPLPAAIKTVLSPEGVKVTAGDLSLEFWWVTALAGAGTPPSWTDMAPGTLVGAVRAAGPFREIRGRTIKPGVYTLRYGLQPQNGDHLGASPFREFLLLSPAAVETDPKPLGVDATNALSKQAIGQSHPAVLSLDPPVATGAVLTSYKSEL